MRTILISGASRGIGLNIAHKELKEGNRISVGIRDLESLLHHQMYTTPKVQVAI
ncbi:hypothetical protein OA254_03510 [Prochlorococcus sp. AH-716-P05]|nr:hypothetical protein [Prochlorococcus sp. AH-716-P05]